jgi:hypothetical protein
MKAITVFCVFVVNLNFLIEVNEYLIDTTNLLAYVLILATMIICFAIFFWIPLELHFFSVVTRDGQTYIAAIKINEQEAYRLHLDTMHHVKEGAQKRIG